MGGTNPQPPPMTVCPVPRALRDEREPPHPRPPPTLSVIPEGNLLLPRPSVTHPHKFPPLTPIPDPRYCSPDSVFVFGDHFGQPLVRLLMHEARAARTQGIHFSRSRTGHLCFQPLVGSLPWNSNLARPVLEKWKPSPCKSITHPRTSRTVRNPLHPASRLRRTRPAGNLSRNLTYFC